MNVKAEKPSFEADPLVREFLRVRGRTPNTERAYAIHLKGFFASTGMTPRQIVRAAKANPAKVEKMLTDYLSGLASTGSTKQGRRSVIGSFLAYHNAPINMRRVPTFDVSPERIDYVPTSQELQKILEHATNPRAKLAILLQAHSGLRFKPLVRLKLKHFPEMVVDNAQKRVSFTNQIATPIAIPAYVERKDKTEKIEHFDKGASFERTAFLSPQGMNALRDYLELRMRKGETLTGESYLFNLPDGGRISEAAIRSVLRAIFQKAGFPQSRPYVCKKYFESKLSASGIREDIQAYLSGWKSAKSLTMRYSYQNIRQNPEMLEELRSQYALAVEKLQINSNGNGTLLRREVQSSKEDILRLTHENLELKAQIETQQKLAQTLLAQMEKTTELVAELQAELDELKGLKDKEEEEAVAEHDQAE